MNKTIIGIIIAVVVVIGGIYLFTQTPQTNTNTTNTQGSTGNTNTTPATNATGKVVFAISDVAVNMSTISEINMTISSIDIYNQTNGWITVSGTPQTYNLLDLNAKNQSKVFTDFQAPVGTYDMIRLSVNKIVVVTKAGITQEAKLPSGELKISTTLVVKDGATSSVNFDFLADKSLHMTGNGGYIFAPVVKTETRSDTNVTVNGDSTVKINGGNVDTNRTDGMDVNGSVKENFQLNVTDKLDVVNGEIKLGDTSNNNTPKASSISIKNFSFSPATLAIKTGTKVTWINDDTVSHTVTSDSGNLLNSGTLSPGQSFSFTFTDTGAVNYHCSIHPMMKGKIVVQK